MLIRIFRAEKIDVFNDRLDHSHLTQEGLQM